MRHPECLSLEFEAVGAPSRRIINLGLLLLIFNFEYLLPPRTFLLFDGGPENCVVLNVSLVLHILVDPLERVVIEFDDHRAIELFFDFANYEIEDEVH